MRRVWLTLLLGLPSLLSAAEPVAGTAPTVRLVAFVGRLESIVEDKTDPCAGDSNCVMMDQVYDADYAVVAPLQGRIERGPIRLRIFDHYGFPQVAKHRHALLFAYVTDDMAVLVKYMGYEMQPLAEGGWASCGNPNGNVELEERPLQFAPGVNFGSVAGLSKKAIAEQFDAGHFSIRDGLAYCRKGVTAEALAEALYPRLVQDLRERQAGGGQ